MIPGVSAGVAQVAVIRVNGRGRKERGEEGLLGYLKVSKRGKTV